MFVIQASCDFHSEMSQCVRLFVIWKREREKKEMFYMQTSNIQSDCMFKAPTNSNWRLMTKFYSHENIKHMSTANTLPINVKRFIPFVWIKWKMCKTVYSHTGTSIVCMLYVAFMYVCNNYGKKRGETKALAHFIPGSTNIFNSYNMIVRWCSVLLFITIIESENHIGTDWTDLSIKCWLSNAFKCHLSFTFRTSIKTIQWLSMTAI